MKKILSLDLGITSIGYSILEKKQNNHYTLIDYGVSMFDSPFDKDGKSKKLLHSTNTSMSNLYAKRKQRKKALAKLFEEFGLEKAHKLLQQEKQNIYKNKWQLRCDDVFTRELSVGEFFTILYFIAKHRGYKSLDTNELLEELCEELKLNCEMKSSKKDDEKGKIKQALKRVEELKQNTNKTVAQIIYELELQKQTPTFRNHDNYNYMIRREYIEDELKKLVDAQQHFFKNNKDEFFEKLKEIIIKQDESSNDLNLFANCEYYKEHKVANQYSVVADIFKMYESVANITLNKEKITKEQIKLIADDFFIKIKKGKNIADIKYKDIRKILKLSDDIKIFGKSDSYVSKGKTIHNTIIKFHFLNNLSKFDNSFIVQNLDNLEKLAEIFEVLNKEKSPKTIFEKLNGNVDEKTIIKLIRYKSGKSLNISHYAMLKFIPYFQEGLTTDEIKQKLDLNRCEDYLAYKKGIKYLHINQFEKDDNLEINNHPVKYIVSAVMRVVKHLHTLYGAFDEIKVESTRELSLDDKTRKDIQKANQEFEKKLDDIKQNSQYQQIAQEYDKNLSKYTKKILMWQEQDRVDIYSGKTIGLNEIFSNEVDIDHIVPQSIGGLSVKHNLVLVHRDTNLQKSNQLPMNFVADKVGLKNRVEKLFSEHKINFKKMKNLLATNLDEIYKDSFESKSLRATSYIEALTAQMLKRYYPFADKQKQKDGSAVRHIQGRATSNIRKLLHVKTKVRDTNIHHGIDALLIGVTSHSWLQKISNTFRENFGVIDDKARERVKKELPLIEGVSVAELVAHIEENYNIYGEESVFYKDVFGNVRVVPFWVSKKSMVSKIHKDTIYAKKQNGIFTVREKILNKFISLKITPKTSSDEFMKKFKKEILEKMYLYKTNPKDKICAIIEQRAFEIAKLLDSLQLKDTTDKEMLSETKKYLDEFIHQDLKDYNGNVIRKVQFYQTNLTGFEIRGGLATKEKTFIGFSAILNGKKIKYKRIDVANFESMKKVDGFKVYKNDVVFFIYPDGSFNGGKIVSFLEDKKMASFSNPRFPANIGLQPHSFVTLFKGKANSHKQHSLNKAIGIIKLNLNVLGNIKSFSSMDEVDGELLEFLKGLKG